MCGGDAALYEITLTTCLPLVLAGCGRGLPAVLADGTGMN